jgi:hypothetical protein
MPELKPQTFSKTHKVMLALALGVVLLWPGDVPWRIDDATFFKMAQSHLSAPVTQTLTGQAGGSTGLQYGALTTWIYRFALKLTHDFRWIVLSKALLTFGVVIFSVLRIATILNLPFSIFYVLLGSPFLYLYSRMFWDNAYLIPYSAVLFWGAAEFFEKRSRKGFLLITLAGTLSFNTHLMVCRDLFSLFLVCFIFRKKWFLENLTFAIAVLTTATLLTFPYFSQLLQPHHSSSSHSLSFSGGFLHLLLSPLYFSFTTFFHYFFPRIWESIGISKITCGIVYVGLILSAIPLFYFTVGVISSFKEVRTKFRRSHITLPTNWTTFDLLTLWSALEALLSMGVFAIFGLHAHPHYHNSNWTYSLFFIGFGLQQIEKKHPRLLRKILVSGVTINAIFLWVFIWQVHKRGGNLEEHFGLTLNNQVQVASQMSKDGQWTSQLSLLKQFPDTIDVLKLILGTEVNSKGPIEIEAISTDPFDVYLRIKE